jgi:uncharacterized DUF497 family protein
MRITFNRDKRDLTLRERGLDFADEGGVRWSACHSAG